MISKTSSRRTALRLPLAGPTAKQSHTNVPSSESELTISQSTEFCCAQNVFRVMTGHSVGFVSSRFLSAPIQNCFPRVAALWKLWFTANVVLVSNRGIFPRNVFVSSVFRYPVKKETWTLAMFEYEVNNVLLNRTLLVLQTIWVQRQDRTPMEKKMANCSTALPKRTLQNWSNLPRGCAKYTKKSFSHLLFT